MNNFDGKQTKKNQLRSLLTYEQRDRLVKKYNPVQRITDRFLTSEYKYTTFFQGLCEIQEIGRFKFSLSNDFTQMGP
jgi:hypothetical protein